MSQYHVIPDHYCSQSRRRLSITQPENNPPLVHRHSKCFLGKPCRRIFGDSSHDNHHNTDLYRFPTIKKGTIINQHPHSYQKERDKNSISDKYDPVHQRRGSGNQTVQSHSGQKSADNRLDTSNLRQKGPQKHHDQHENILGYIILTTLKKPTPDPGKYQHHE